MAIRPELRRHRGVVPAPLTANPAPEVVRRSLPRNVPPLLTRRVGGLLRLDLLQHGRQPLVLDDRAGLHCLDLVEHLETERRSVELNREPSVRVIHYLHLLARQATASEVGSRSSIIRS